MAAERLFRAKVIRFLSDEGLLSEERVALLDSWRHSGFSVHNSVTVGAGDTAGIDRLRGTCCHAPLSSERLAYDEEQDTVHYTPKGVRHSRMAEAAASTPWTSWRACSCMCPSRGCTWCATAATTHRWPALDDG